MKHFISSWNMKKRDDRYIKSIYYDIRKDNGYTSAMIFTNDIDKIVLYEKGFYCEYNKVLGNPTAIYDCYVGSGSYFGNKHTILVPYNEYGKFLIRNNYKVRHSIYLRIKEMYDVELSDFKFADLKLDDNNYIVIMALIDMERLAMLHYYFNENDNHNNVNDHFVGSDKTIKMPKGAEKTIQSRTSS